MFQFLLTSYPHAIQNYEISGHDAYYLKIKSHVSSFPRSMFIIHYYNISLKILV